MKTNLFDESLSSREILDNLEAENCGVEEHHEFIKSFTEDEMIAKEREHLELSKEIFSLKKDLEVVTTPIKEALKPKVQEEKEIIQQLNAGGIEVTEKVYCFPDYESKIMGLYDQRGHLVGTRPMTKNERQLHINSHLNRAI